ncbi:MAG: diaminopimelate decarboxylase, partial [Candidatus Eremiobacteraeota bacterium]|nr:diaminopimelate decarboxylase [Candidatus Eremiobacteraeota bacterium]
MHRSKFSIHGRSMHHNSKHAVDVTPVTGGSALFGGCDAQSLAAQFGTPLLVIDEVRLRSAMRAFREAFVHPRWRASVAYAGKALLLQAIAKIAHEESLSIDVCSAGELQTALRAGVPAQRCIFHGCFKTDDELDLAVQSGIGYIVVDHRAEIDAVALRASRFGGRCDILLRVNPGIAAQTRGAIQTGAPDSKFGFAIDDGQALAAVAAAANSPALRLAGIHAHIGSQIFDVDSYAREIVRLTDFAKAVHRSLAVTFDVMNIGGGLAVADSPGTQAPDAKQWAQTIFGAFEECFADLNLAKPQLCVEPGRALIASAGTTLYRIGVRKRLPDGTVALIVDGGMSDNPRPALYEADYAVTLPARARLPADGTYKIFGRHCEADRLFRDVALPGPLPGDVLAVHGTGAYTYS